MTASRCALITLSNERPRPLQALRQVRTAANRSTVIGRAAAVALVPGTLVTRAELTSATTVRVKDGETLTTDGPPVRSGYGDLQSVRYVATGPHRTFVYPRSAGQPEGAAVRDSFATTANGWKTVLGRVEGARDFSIASIKSLRRGGSEPFWLV